MLFESYEILKHIVGKKRKSFLNVKSVGVHDDHCDFNVPPYLNKNAITTYG
jgi:hypothetical protein